MRRSRSGSSARSVCALAFASLILGLMSLTQVGAKQPRRIGRLLMADPCPPNNLFEAEDALTTALAERGWKQGQNFVWDCVSAGGRLRDLDKLAAELVARRPELLETQSSPAIHALIATKTTIPIVMSTPAPVGDGFAQSLARPGGNITGVADRGLDLAVKPIELARELVPALTKVAVLERVGGDATYYKRLEDRLNRSEDRFGIQWRVYPHQSRPEDLEPHFRDMQQDGFNLLYLIATPFTFGNRKLISDLALKHGIRMLSEHPQFAQDGALLSYGVDNDEVQRHMAPQIDAVLRGARPETLPIDQMAKLHLVINLKTAQALGVEVPPEILVRADEVIE